MIETETRTDKDIRWEKAKEIFENLSPEKQEELRNAVTCDPIEYLLLIVS